MSQVGGFFFALMALVSVLGALVTIAARSPSVIRYDLLGHH
jgi:hypothetical protein